MYYVLSGFDTLLEISSSLPRVHPPVLRTSGPNPEPPHASGNIVRPFHLTLTHLTHLALQSEHQNPIRRLTKVCLLHSRRHLRGLSYVASLGIWNQVFTLQSSHARARIQSKRDRPCSSQTRNSPIAAHSR